MSINTPFTKDNLDNCLKELGKEFRKRNGTKTPAEIVLIGGAAVLANYGFRELTYDVDAIIIASSAMKGAVNNVGDRLGLPNGWLNMDFKKTSSYSDKLLEKSVYYRTFSNVLTVRTVTAEYIIAMKLVAGREYKFDLSDIAGILFEHEKSDNPISYEAIDKAMNDLYGGWHGVSANAKQFLDDAFSSGNYAKLYSEVRESENNAKEIRLRPNQGNSQAIIEDDTADILNQAKQKPSLKDTLEANKKKSKEMFGNGSSQSPKSKNEPEI